MPGWDLIVRFAGGAMDSVWMVWPWLFAMVVLEWVMPGKRLDFKTWVFNALYVPVYLTVAALVLYPAVLWISPQLPVNVLGLQFDKVGSLGLAGLILLYLIVFDFFFYWFHRAQHGWAFMWRYHRFHHADCNVAVTTATRHHWVEELNRYFFISVPLVILVGHPQSVLPQLGVALGIGGMFIHWNTPLRLGWFTGIVVGPQYHRIHHSFAPAHIDKNFSVLFPFWDRLFGTQCMPVGREFPDTGVTEVRRPNGWRLLLPWPSKNA